MAEDDAVAATLPPPVFTDKGSHDRSGARAILPMQLCERLRLDDTLLLQPPEISLDQARAVIEYVRWPLEAAFLQPQLQDRESW